MKEKEYCPRCNSEIKGGLRPNKQFSLQETKFINFFLHMSELGFCTSCDRGLLTKAIETKKQAIKERRDFITTNIDKVPVVSLQSPKDWNYEVVRMITAQKVMGTGIFSEISSSWTDFFGKPSGAYAQKIREGENACFNAIRIDCIRTGGEAVIGTDIDYSDIGSGKNMIMICLSGTAIKFKNIEAVPNGPIISEMTKKYKEMEEYRMVYRGDEQYA